MKKRKDEHRTQDKENKASKRQNKKREWRRRLFVLFVYLGVFELDTLEISNFSAELLTVVHVTHRRFKGSLCKT